jgi:hypothetical protein
MTLNATPHPRSECGAKLILGYNAKLFALKNHQFYKKASCLQYSVRFLQQNVCVCTFPGRQSQQYFRSSSSAACREKSESAPSHKRNGIKLHLKQKSKLFLSLSLFPFLGHLLIWFIVSHFHSCSIFTICAHSELS